VSPRERRPRIVVGYDGSETARAAVAWAAERAGQSGTVYVVHCFSGPVDWYDPLGAGHVPEDHARRGKAVLDALLLEGGSALLDVDYELELVGGNPAKGITAVASERDADEIVVGSHGFGKLRAALGSVSHDLLHSADRPVTVIPYRAVREHAGSAS
jgi:nucleotide-binding universal stress UspA family protein